MTERRAADVPKKCTTGVAGLDEVLRGGLPPDRLYLVRGEPGVGKTTLSLQFLLAGAERGEPGLYITLSETKAEVEEVARSHGWNLDNLAVFELSALEQQLAQDAQNTIFHPAEVELNRTTDALLAEIERIKPQRLALDSLSELRLLAETGLRYRRQMLALKQYFVGKKITVLLLDDHDKGPGDPHVQSIAHGVVTIEQIESDYGAVRRRIKINKLRGVDFMGGYHDAVIVPGGLQVFPRLVAAEHHQTANLPTLKSGSAGMDALIGGGLEPGTSTLLLGPAGTGKSSIAMQFACAAAARGQKAYVYIFEESAATLFGRAESMGMPVRRYVDEGRIVLRQVDPAKLAPGRFAHVVQQNVDVEQGCVVVLDSLNGYLHAMPDAKFLMVQLHELFALLGQRGVITILTLAQHGLVGNMRSPVDLTYLADTVVLLRYFEHGGGIRKAVSVIKKRIGPHEKTIREFRLSERGLHVGEPLHEFRGVLTGVPVFRGESDKMLPPS